jgi:hypothetical protein
MDSASSGGRVHHRPAVGVALAFGGGLTMRRLSLHEAAMLPGGPPPAAARHAPRPPHLHHRRPRGLGRYWPRSACTRAIRSSVTLAASARAGGAGRPRIPPGAVDLISPSPSRRAATAEWLGMQTCRPRERDADQQRRRHHCPARWPTRLTITRAACASAGSGAGCAAFLHATRSWPMPRKC